MDFLPAWPLAINTQIAFGILLLAGALGGHVAHRLNWLPSITGFMIVGLLIGPSGVGLLTADALVLSRPIIDIALGLILYRLGLSLDLRLMRRSLWVVALSLIESGVTFGVCMAIAIHFGLPPLIAALAAAIVISSSPAVLLHVAHELGASGPVTERAKELVALNNVVSFVVFSALLPAGHLANDAELAFAILQPLYEAVGSMLMAALVGWGLYRLGALMRRAKQYRLALIIGAILLGVGLADALNMSVLFVPLAIGVVVSTLEHDDNLSEVEFGESFELFFIVLFVFAGAKIKPELVLGLAPLALLLIAGRAVAKISVVFAMTRWRGTAPRPALAGGLLLMPMAGLAIGLLQTADTLFALQTQVLGSLILATVAMLETLGPPLAAFAFRLAGEVPGEAAGEGRAAAGEGEAVVDVSQDAKAPSRPVD